MLPFQSNPHRTSTPYLVVHILDNKENRTVKRCWFTVQSLQASPMLQCAVCEPPWISLHPCRQVPGKLGNRQRGKWLHIQQAGSQVVPQIIPLWQGLLSQKVTFKGAADASSLTFPLHACGLVLSPTVCVHITCERYFKTGTSSPSTERVASLQYHKSNSRVAKHNNKLSRWASDAAKRTLHKDTLTY